MKKVTMQDVIDSIESETYTLLPDGRTTVCQLTIAGGFTVNGISSCLTIENFDATIGNEIARENAKGELWKLLGFALHVKLLDKF